MKAEARRALSGVFLFLLVACGGGGGGGGATPDPDPTPLPEAETLLPLGDTSEGPLLSVAAQTDTQGTVHPLPVADAPVQPLMLGQTLGTTFRVIDDENFQIVPNVRVDVVSDNHAAVVLCSDPAFMPTVHPVTIPGAGTVDVFATSVFASSIQRRGNGEYWGRIRPYSAVHTRTSHLDMLRERFFMPVASGASWSTVESSVTSHLTDWSQPGRANGNHAYVIVAIPITSGVEAEHKLICFRGDAVVMGAWLSANMPAYFGKSSYTFDVHKYTGVEAQRLLLVTLNTLEVQAESVGTGVVQGVCRTPAGLLAGADVSLHGFDPRCRVFETIRTGADGAYRFQGVPSGSYILRVRKSGYESAASDNAIIDEEGGTVTEDLWLNTSPNAYLAYDASITYVLPGVTTAVGAQIANRGGSQNLTWSFSSALPPPGTWTISPLQGVLRPGESQWIQFTPPAGAKANSYTMRITSDVGGETGFLYFPIYVEGSRNLILQNPTLSVSSVRPGNKVDVNYNFSGTGPGSGSHYLSRITISKSPTISPTDARLDDDDVYGAYSRSFMPSASGASTTRVVMPPWLTPGTWYVGITLDGSNLLSETNEQDNVVSLPITIIDQTSAVARPGPFAVSSATAEYKAGKLQIPVVWTVASGASQYQVRRNGIPISPVLSDGTTEWVDLSVQEGVSYSYDVIATNAGGTKTAKPFLSTVTKKGQPYVGRLQNGDFGIGSTASGSVPGWTATGDFWVGQGSGFDAYGLAPGYAAGGANRTTGIATGATTESRGDLWQVFTIPTSTSRAWLSFSYNITTDEPSPVVPLHDTMTVALYDLNDTPLKTLATFGNGDGIGQVRGAYIRKMLDLRNYIGKTVKLGFSVTSRPPNPTLFRIDDIELLLDSPEPSASLLRWPMTGSVTHLTGDMETSYPSHKGTDLQSAQVRRIGLTSGDPTWQAAWTLNGNRTVEIYAGADVYAAGPGRVSFVSLTSATAGRYVVIDHGNGCGVKTRYLHLNTVFVATGDDVTSATKIGVEGNTGQVEGVPTRGGCHLHFELLRPSNSDNIPDPGEWRSSPVSYVDVERGAAIETTAPGWTLSCP